MSENLYEILGVSKNSTPDEIKKAYKKLAIKHHPDKGGDENIFKKINEAYQVLSDANKKASYDATGNVNGFNGKNHSAEDVFNEHFEKFKTAYGFGGNRVRKGQSIQIVISLKLEEIFSGVKRKLNYKKDKNCYSCNGNGSKDGKSIKTCDTCNGHGFVVIKHGNFHIENTCHSCGGYGKTILEECDICYGAGVEKKDTSIEIEIPAGVRDGWQTSVPGFGNDAFAAENGVPGDLLIMIKQIPHEKFDRDGDDLIYRTRISFPLAAIGGKLEVPTIENKIVSFDLSECTQNGKVFRLSNRGFPSFTNKGSFGNMLVLVELIMPTSLNDKERDLLKELLKQENFKTI